MSEQPDAKPAKHEIDRFALESAIMDVQGDALVLDLVIESLGAGDAWSLVGREPMDGYKLWLLTNDQVRMLHHANGRMMKSADDAAVAFYGRELARSA